MAKTYAQIQAQIDKLTKEADALKAREVAGVVARIQDAIAHYGLTPQDLFSQLPAAGRKTGAGAKGPAKKTGRRQAAKPAKAPSPAKFQDEAGNRWSGVGKRPNWFKAALAAGKTADELRVKPADAG